MKDLHTQRAPERTITREIAGGCLLLISPKLLQSFFKRRAKRQNTPKAYRS